MKVLWKWLQHPIMSPPSRLILLIFWVSLLVLFLLPVNLANGIVTYLLVVVLLLLILQIIVFCAHKLSRRM